MPRPSLPAPRTSGAAALVFAVLAASGAVQAQMVRPLPAPMSPSAEAPAPPDLAARPRPSAVPVIPPLALPPGFAVLPEGGWRLSGGAGRAEPDAEGRRGVETIGRYLAEFTTGRVTVLVQVAGPGDDASIARRASLARAIAIKSAMMRAGLPGTRIDLRPMGRTEEARDGVDILASPPHRAASAAAGR